MSTWSCTESAVEMILGCIALVVREAIPTNYICMAAAAFAALDSADGVSFKDLASLNVRLEGLSKLWSSKDDVGRFLVLRTKYTLCLLDEARQGLATLQVDGIDEEGAKFIDDIVTHISNAYTVLCKCTSCCSGIDCSILEDEDHSAWIALWASMVKGANEILLPHSLTPRQWPKVKAGLLQQVSRMKVDDLKKQLPDIDVGGLAKPRMVELVVELKMTAEQEKYTKLEEKWDDTVVAFVAVVKGGDPMAAKAAAAARVPGMGASGGEFICPYVVASHASMSG